MVSSRLSVHAPSPYAFPLSPSSSTTTLESEPTVKKKRKRTDAEQLKVLNETYTRTAFPSTEERIELGKKLSMSARSVQIWFQNKRRWKRQNPHRTVTHTLTPYSRSPARFIGRSFQEGPTPLYEHIHGRPTLDSDIFTLLHRTLMIDVKYPQAANGLNLQEADVPYAMDLMKKLLDDDDYWMVFFNQHAQQLPHDNPPHKCDLRAHLHKLLWILCKIHRRLPPSMYLSGVVRHGEEYVGSGGFSDIFHGVFCGKKIALKCLRTFTYSDSVQMEALQKAFCHEVLIWAQLKHPNLLPLLGIHADPSSAPANLCMVLPLAKYGNILECATHLDKSGSEKPIKRWLMQIAQALAYLHSQGVVHGDLRGTNILIGDDLQVLITDFGLSSFVNENYTPNHGLTNGGSARWMAPELHQAQASISDDELRASYASDVYAFGCVCVELYSGQPPQFDRPMKNAIHISKAVRKGARPVRPTDMPDDIWQIVESCWEAEPVNRPSAPRLVELLAACQSDV